jgi:hypothetical protein
MPASTKGFTEAAVPMPASTKGKQASKAGGGKLQQFCTCPFFLLFFQIPPKF